MNIRQIRKIVSIEAQADFAALMHNQYELWIARISRPDYVFTDWDHTIFEALMRFKAEQERANGPKNNS